MAMKFIFNLYRIKVYIGVLYSVCYQLRNVSFFCETVHWLTVAHFLLKRMDKNV